MTSRLGVWTGCAGILALLIPISMFCVDHPLAQAAQDFAHAYPEIERGFRVVTELGESSWYLWSSGLSGLICWGLARSTYWPRAHARLMQGAIGCAWIFSCVAISGILTQILKRLIGRPRPSLSEKMGLDMFVFMPFAGSARWQSMPSGHATTVFVLLLALLPFLSRPWRGAGLALALVIAASRIITNAHYLSDLFAGALVAVATVGLLTPRFARLLPRLDMAQGNHSR
ncbi:MAG: phosphatase PAP2 family protein [Alphaproteobacteria bacterium]|nr:MAG: phosphatase PAP2 family protein [Alphaproteobacteria bacterium]